MAIKVLPPDVSEKIAAGEVILRPSSVVKELIENSIDAGAARISVEAEHAGKSLIRVTDDGCGIPGDEIACAFRHHATSKVTSVDDLAHINTMGFRGEALPSVAAVSEMTMISRASGAGLGGRLDVSFGRIGQVIDAGAPFGTTVEVRGLFSNMPARLKFLKSDRTEWGRIASIVTHAALICPQIAFDLVRDGKTVVSAESHPDVISRIEKLFGAPITESLIPVSGGLGEVSLEGWIGTPSLTRNNMNMVHVYVNRRYVRVPAAARALKDSYGEYLARGRCPVAFLFIEVPPSSVDVNVHPSKEEIRFRDTGLVHDAVKHAIRGALANTGAARVLSTSLGKGIARIRRDTPGLKTAGDDTGPGKSPGAVFERELPYHADRVPLIDVRAREQRVRRFMQVHNSFIVVEDEDGVMLVDQHALHERILLEEFKNKLSIRSVEKQRLLIPANVDLTPDEMAGLDEVKDCLSDLGLVVEKFGGNTVVVRTVPALLKAVDPADLLLEIIDGIKPGTDRDSKLRNLIGLMACKGAVKAGDKLSGKEISALLEKAGEIDFSGACAHGRPTHILLTLAEIEKMFGRR